MVEKILPRYDKNYFRVSFASYVSFWFPKKSQRKTHFNYLVEIMCLGISKNVFCMVFDVLQNCSICIGSDGRLFASFAWDRWQDSQKSLETSPQFHLNWTHPQLWGNVLGRLVKAGIKAATGTRISYPTHLFCSRPIPLRQRHRLRRRGYPRRHGQVLQLRMSSSHVFTNSVTTNLRKKITKFYQFTFLRGKNC